MSESGPGAAADRILFPGFRQARVTARETKIDAMLGGQGSPVLLLHGYPETHACWHRIAAGLATRFTLVGTDLQLPGPRPLGRPPATG